MAATSLSSDAGKPLPPAMTAPAKLYEQALTLSAMGLHEEALKALCEVTARAPDHAPAWLKLAELLRLAGKLQEAGAAAARAAGGSRAWSPPLDGRAAAEIQSEEIALRERLGKMRGTPEIRRALHKLLLERETDVAGMRLLARMEWKDGELMTARALIERALALAPDYNGARADLVQLLRALSEDSRAVAETARLVAGAPDDFTYRALHDDALLTLGDFKSGIPLLEQLIREQPDLARLRCVYAQALHFAGRDEDSVREFRAALQLQPGMGEAYWGVAQLRGHLLDADDIATMNGHLQDSDANASGRLPLHYALGQALEEAGDCAGSFAAYEAGAASLRAIAIDNGQIYNSAKDFKQLHRRITAFSAPLLARAAAAETSNGAPIFVLGMPRSGSTLVEQILSSHGQVEATMELPLLGNITRDLARSRLLVTPDAYPECVAGLTAAELVELGARYLQESAAYRETNRPWFIDKRPANWLDAGLIHMILPQAKIIDIRREPMAACFAMYKHMLADDATFPYEFKDLAHYYIYYVRLMEHYNEVIPGRIHFISYERLVENTEAEIHRLLEYCGLPFEENCLDFWKTVRAVATPSAGQVRRPIYREALQQWRNFEPWLAPLKKALAEAEIAAAAAPQPEGYERAMTLAAMGIYDAAIEELQEITCIAPTHPGVWKKLSEFLRLAGDDEAADSAHVAALQYAGGKSRWRSDGDTRSFKQQESAGRRLETQLAGADRDKQMEMLCEHLLENPTDSVAMHLLARLELQNNDEVTAQSLLERATELAPFHLVARAELAFLLMRRSAYFDALEQTRILLEQSPGNADFRALRSDALQCVGAYPEALEETEKLLREHPRSARFWFGHGLLLHYIGRRDDSAGAFRTSLELEPTMGEAWWGLADLKGDFLTDADANAIRASLADTTLDPSSRMYMYYALGHVLERTSDHSGSFAAYQQGARLFRGTFLGRGEAYSEDEFVERLRGVKRVFTAGTLATHGARPDASPPVTPIFIVGMPRAGSTLVEQILASHSQVEATRELSAIREIVRDLAQSGADGYPDCLLNPDPDELAALGQRYLRNAGAYRKTKRPYFIDKRPWNWMDAGLIRMILPRAKIIDVRREPMAACFAMFKQILPQGADFSYDLHDLGRYYTEYASMMEHWESVMPGRIHFLQYERLVEHTETEVRRLLDYCGLPFEESCLRFWESERAISTPSAGQVRRPIFRDALQQWRNFEPWLGPLKDALSQQARA